jgi:hypothetical protein
VKSSSTFIWFEPVQTVPQPHFFFFHIRNFSSKYPLRSHWSLVR